MLAYLAGPRVGAFGYNLMHTYTLAFALVLRRICRRRAGVDRRAALSGSRISASTARWATASNIRQASAIPISAALAGVKPRSFQGNTMRIHAIETGRVRIKQAQIEGRGHGLWRQLQPIASQEWADWMPVYAWAIEHPEGVIVVDTGAATHLKSLPRWHPYFQLSVRFEIEPEQEIGPQLKERGIGARRRQDGSADAPAHRPRRWPGSLSPQPYPRERR